MVVGSKYVYFVTMIPLEWNLGQELCQSLCFSVKINRNTYDVVMRSLFLFSIIRKSTINKLCKVNFREEEEEFTTATVEKGVVGGLMLLTYSR